MADRDNGKDEGSSGAGSGDRSDLADVTRRGDWHAVAAGDALHLLQTEEDGLDEAEVERRQERFGPNKLPEEKPPGLLRIFLEQYKNPLIYVLLIAGIVSLGIGNYSDAAFIFAVLLLNAVIGTVQESRAGAAAESLQAVMTISAAVNRGGERRTVDSTALVPGDIVQVDAGATVPADLRLLSASELQADESLLTGESMPAPKDHTADLDEETPLGDRATMLFAGTTVLSGSATGVVCHTGEQSQIGRIAESLSEAESQPPLVVRLERFTRNVAFGVMALIAVLAAGQFLRGAEPLQIFFLAVALAVSAIPAGLPVAITVALSIASNRMAGHNVIVRQLPAVEGLGACTLIASDKTGTLTANKLTVKQLLVGGDEGNYEVGGEGLSLEGDVTRDGQPPDDEESRRRIERFARAGALCNEGHLSTEGDEIETAGDTVDVAFLVLARKLDLDLDELGRDHPRVGEIPFKSERRFAASFNREDGNTVAYVKGAAETIVEMCGGADRDSILEQADALAERGYRVLALAAGKVSEDRAEQADENALEGLDFLGLAGLIDPVRPEVPEAIKKSRRAGVRVCMITGDHPATAFAIARELGIAETREQVVTGRDLADIEDDAELARIVDEVRVFARIEPAQKTRIVTALQESGHFVAVTGDGVNDAPALRAANIGVAMGESGTDVARNAADLILTDDNFASIVEGIEQGRIAYDNVRKVTWLLISTGIAEVTLFLLAFAAGIPLPLDPVQLLWLNLVTNGIQDVALAFEKGEPGILDRPPRAPAERIFDRWMIERALLSDVIMGCIAFGVFYWLFEVAGWSEFESRNALLLLMVLFENVHIFNCRSERRSAFRIPLANNWLLVGTVVAAQGLHIAAMFIPGLNTMLEIEPVSLSTWLSLLPIALTILLVMEIYKYFRASRIAEVEQARRTKTAAAAGSRVS